MEHRVIIGPEADAYHSKALDVLQDLTNEYEGDTDKLLLCMIDVVSTFILVCAMHDKVDLALDDITSSIRQTIHSRLSGGSIQ